MTDEVRRAHPRELGAIEVWNQDASVLRGRLRVAEYANRCKVGDVFKLGDADHGGLIHFTIAEREADGGMRRILTVADHAFMRLQRSPTLRVLFEYTGKEDE